MLALQSLVVLALGVGLFDADLPDRPLSFLLAVALGGIAFAGLGLATAAFVQSAESVAAVVNVIILPMSFLSGAFGSADALPRVLELVADVLPLKYLIELVLGTYVEGETIADHPGAIAMLAVWGAAGYLVARSRFGWEPRER